MSERPVFKKPECVKDVLDMTKRPSHVVVTAGMPYANGPLHLGHLAGAHVPADVLARFYRMLIGDKNVLFVCGTDDHGSTSEVAAITKGKSIHDFISEIHVIQEKTMRDYSISLNVYSGTSRPETFPHHSKFCQEELRKLMKNGMLERRVTKQWYDPKFDRFLQDRFVYGTCPNPKCQNKKAYSDECDVCGATYDPSELIDPISSLSGETPVLKDTAHWWLDLWKVSDELRTWVKSKEKVWRKPVYTEVSNTVQPCISFSQDFEEEFKNFKAELPKHKSRYSAGRQIVVQLNTLDELETARSVFKAHNIETSLVDGWAHRSITRDVTWGIPLPLDLDPTMENKTLYVWPDSLWAPISFSRTALKAQGRDESEYKDFWCDPSSKVYQFLGQDNVYFYSLMQGALWLGAQDDIHRLPNPGELQLTDIFGCFHLQVNNEKMSKSKGNFYTGDELLTKFGYSADQIRYFLALLSLPEKASNFDFNTLNERNKFLAGPLNAAIEKPISACNSKFGGVVPEGKLLPKVEKETLNIVQKYLKQMARAEYSTLLFAIENYARLINSLFVQYKPHDDRHDLAERQDALYSCFYVLKNMMIMLYPFVPTTMEKVMTSLNLDQSVFSVDNLGTGLQPGHIIGEKLSYFPPVNE